jgi:hypothetical protein
VNRTHSVTWRESLEPSAGSIDEVASRRTYRGSEADLGAEARLERLPAAHPSHTQEFLGFIKVRRDSAFQMVKFLLTGGQSDCN